MSGWPPITDPELLRRLALPDEAFREELLGFASSVGERAFTDAEYTLALGYPWPRPPSSFALDGDEVTPLGAWDAAVADGRHPLLAFGSNGAPETLIRKFAHLPERDRRVVVLAGDLHDFDVAAAGYPTAYGSFPATLVASPGTALRASVLWVTPEQLTALTWTEISYRLGRLDGVTFTPDIDGPPAIDHVLAYSSRWGAHVVDGELAALAALPARGRTAPAYDQEHLLDDLARRVLGPEAGARDLVAWIYADFGVAAARMGPVLQDTARPFASDRWTPYPA